MKVSRLALLRTIRKPMPGATVVFLDKKRQAKRKRVKRLKPGFDPDLDTI